MPAEPAPSTDTSKEHVDRFEVLVAILLGLAATLTAWAAFQGGLLGGDSQQQFAKAAVSSDQAGQYWNLGSQTMVNDEGLFRDYAIADRAGNDALATYLFEDLMEENLQDAVLWLEQDDDETNTSPFVDDPDNPYKTLDFEEGERLDALAVKQARKGEELGGRGDKFDGVTVLLATALFLFGLAAVFRGRAIRRGTLGVGAVLLAISAVRLVDLGVHQWTA